MFFYKYSMTQKIWKVKMLDKDSTVHTNSKTHSCTAVFLLITKIKTKNQKFYVQQTSALNNIPKGSNNCQKLSFGIPCLFSMFIELGQPHCYREQIIQDYFTNFLISTIQRTYSTVKERKKEKTSWKSHQIPWKRCKTCWIVSFLRKRLKKHININCRQEVFFSRELLQQDQVLWNKKPKWNKKTQTKPKWKIALEKISRQKEKSGNFFVKSYTKPCSKDSYCQLLRVRPVFFSCKHRHTVT